MAQDRFLIAPLDGGLDTSLKPWLIPDSAYAELNNAYVFRGRTRKRFGSRLMNSDIPIATQQLYSRVRIEVDTLAAGSSSGTVPGTKFNVGQMFSIGDNIFTVYQLGTPGDMLIDGTASTATFNTTSGVFVFTGVSAPNGTPVYFYPAQPIMGLISYETSAPLNDPTYAFDTQFAYEYTGGGWERLGTALWSGSDSQFFWGNTWQGANPFDRNLFVVNNNAADGIKYWDGTNWNNASFNIDTAGTLIDTALIVVTFKNRLIFLNTTEGGNTYTNRARYAAFGDPTATDAWNQQIPGKGNAIDAATMEDIVSCEFIKDRLIVFFEQSTWELAYTGNQAYPFQWYQLNTELGAEATFSVVPFDIYALAIGNVGIHSCNGVNVQRIDDKIPDQVWQIHTGVDSARRVYGVRDYYVEQVYWTFPNRDANQFSQTYPNKILVYNYKTGSWAFNDDSITAFGYYFATTASAITWSSTTVTWDSDITWNSGTTQPLNQYVLAGNQEGFVFIIDPDSGSNAPALQVTNITLDGSNNVIFTVINHNLNIGDYLAVDNLNGFTPIGTDELPDVVRVAAVFDANNFVVINQALQNCLTAMQEYTGGAVLSRLSAIDILTKQFNFYAKEGRNFMVQQINCLVDRTNSGAIAVDYLTGTSSGGSTLPALNSGCLVGTSILDTTPYALYPFEEQQDRLWHPVYMIADGNAIQFRFYLSGDQLMDREIAQSQFQLHAFVIYAQKTNSRLQ